MPRCVYGMFHERMDSCWYLWFMLCSFRYAGNASGSILGLSRHPFTAHLFIPRSIWAHLEHSLSLFS